MILNFTIVNFVKFMDYLPNILDYQKDISFWWGNGTYNCQSQPVYSYVLGILLCVGGILSYLPHITLLSNLNKIKELVKPVCYF